VCLVRSAPRRDWPRGTHAFPYTTLFRSRLRDGQGRRRVVVRAIGADPDAVGAVQRRVEGELRVERSAAVIVASPVPVRPQHHERSEEHTSELQSREISYAVFCLKKKTAI